MDKTDITNKDLESLFTWRDKNKDLVRQFPAPLKAIEIRFVENSLRMVCVRDGKFVTLRIFDGFRGLGNVKLRLEESGFAYEKVSIQSPLKIPLRLCKMQKNFKHFENRKLRLWITFMFQIPSEKVTPTFEIESFNSSNAFSKEMSSKFTTLLEYNIYICIVQQIPPIGV